MERSGMPDHFRQGCPGFRSLIRATIDPSYLLIRPTGCAQPILRAMLLAKMGLNVVNRPLKPKWVFHVFFKSWKPQAQTMRTAWRYYMIVNEEAVACCFIIPY